MDSVIDGGSGDPALAAARGEPAVSGRCSFAPDRFRSLPIFSFPAGNKKAIVYSRATRNARLIDASLVPVLQACDEFKSVHGHARHIASRLTSPDRVCAQLQYLIDAAC
jgi:hypothetical protein